MKKHFLLVVLSIVLFVNNSFGQNVLYDNSVCWEITDPNTSSPSYIFGSFHLLDTCQLKFPIQTIKNLIDKCGCFCSEINITTQDSTAMKGLAKQMFIRDSKQNISNSLEKDYYDKLIQIMDSSKTDLNLKLLKPAIPFMKPSVLGLLVTMEKQLSNIQLYKSSNFRTDLYFENYAVSKGFEINELETYKEQMDMLVNCTFEESIKTLKFCIDEFFSGDSIDILKNYTNQNLKLLKSEMYKDSTMISRNKKMAEGIDRILKNKPVFVMIGAAHLPYEFGVLNLLASKGYMVKPYRIEFLIKDSMNKK